MGGATWDGGDSPPKVRVTKENLVSLPALAPYFAFGLLALAATPMLLWAAAQPLQDGLYRHPRVLAALHGAALGWGTSIALGALQQMTAVVGATRLHSTRLAAAAFWPFSLGVVGLIWGFYTFAPGPLIAAAAGVPLGAGLVVYNVIRTASSAQPTRRWLLISPFVKSALGYALIAFAAGGALALHLTRGWLGAFWNNVFPLHIGMASIGWFFTLVIGISYHLLTFFGLTDKETEFRFVSTVRGLVHGGLAAVIVAGFLLHGMRSGVAGGASTVVEAAAEALRIVALWAFSVAGGLFVWDARGIYRRPPRQRAAAVHHFIRLAHGYLAVVSGAFFVWGVVAGLGDVVPAWALAALGVGSGPNPVHYVALGVLLGGGWLSNTILGYLHRILAFFVWHNKYWGRGREPGVPAFRDMVNPRAAAVGLALFNAGVAGFVVALYVNINLGWTVALWAAGALVITANLVWTMWR